jgi:hypothetical protein
VKGGVGVSKREEGVEGTKDLSWLEGLASCKSRVDSCTECSFAFFAVTTTAVGDVEGHDDPVALLQECHAAPEFFDYAHVLMAFEASWTSQQMANEGKQSQLKQLFDIYCCGLKSSSPNVMPACAPVLPSYC